MQMNHLTDAERLLPRAIRRALQADRTRIIKKGRPFGRVRLTDFSVPSDELYESDPRLAHQRERTKYLHFTKGSRDRRTTIPLLDNLITVG
jgi:hypothetical protein